MGTILRRYLPRRYKSIVKYKTAFYSFYLPVAAAMYMVSGPPCFPGMPMGRLSWGLAHSPVSSVGRH